MTDTKTIEIDSELNREIFEAAQAVRLLKAFSKKTDQPIMLFYADKPEQTCTVFINGYSFVGRTLLEALEMASTLWL